MKVLSLFDGILCARVALERVQVQVDEFYARRLSSRPLT